MNLKFLSSSNERTAIVLKNIYVTTILRGINILIGLILLPMTIHYISSEQYGIWLTLTSIVGWASFFDLGFGNGLRNKLSESVSLGDFERGKSLVSTGYFYIAMIFLAVCVVSCIVIPFVDWNRALNTDLAIEWTSLVCVIVVMFCLQTVLNLINPIVSALQQYSLSSVFTTIGQISMLAGVYLLTKCVEPRMLYLALCLMGIPNIIFLISSIYLYYFNPVYSKIRPSLKCVERKYAREILTLGGHFFVIQVCGILLYQTANLIIIRCCGPDDVTSYNISFKYFSVITMVSGLILAPMWNAFTDAYTRSDYDWMKNTLKRLHRLFALGCVGAVIMCALSSYVYSIWLGDSVHISWQLSVCMMMYIIVCMWNSILSSSLNGIGKIKLSMIMCVVTIPLCIPMAVGLCRVMGSCGVVLSITLINLPFSVLGYIQLKKILAKKDNGIWSK